MVVSQGVRMRIDKDYRTKLERLRLLPTTG